MWKNIKSIVGVDMLGHINSNVSVVGNYSKPFDIGALTKQVLADMFCHKHQLNFRNKVVLTKDTDEVVLKFNCPHCNAEILEAREREAVDKKQHEEDLDSKMRQLDFELNRDLVIESGISETLADFKPKDIGSFSEFKKEIKELDHTIILNGASGTGKTILCVEIIRQHLNSRPIYINCLELISMLKTNEVKNLKDLKERVKNSLLLIFDDAHLLCEVEPLFLETLFDLAGRNQAKFVISGDFGDGSKDFFLKLPDKVQNIAFSYSDILTFSNQSLRTAEKDS